MTGQPKWAARFLEALEATPNITAAARAAGIDRTTAYRRRESDPEFQAAWDDALESSTDALVGKAYQRAMTGECSDTLVIFLLKTHRPEVYGDRSKLELSGPGGSAIPVSIEQTIEQVYGDSDGDDSELNEGD